MNQRLQRALALLRKQSLALHRDEHGVSATEYIIVLVLIACFIIAIIALYGERLQRLYQHAVEIIIKWVRW